MIFWKIGVLLYSNLFIVGKMNQFMLFVLWEAEKKSVLFRRRSDLCPMCLHFYHKTQGIILSGTGTITKFELGCYSLSKKTGTNTLCTFHAPNVSFDKVIKASVFCKTRNLKNLFKYTKLLHINYPNNTRDRETCSTKPRR